MATRNMQNKHMYDDEQKGDTNLITRQHQQKNLQQQQQRCDNNTWRNCFTTKVLKQLCNEWSTLRKKLKHVKTNIVYNIVVCDDVMSSRRKDGNTRTRNNNNFINKIANWAHRTDHCSPFTYEANNGKICVWNLQTELEWCRRNLNRGIKPVVKRDVCVIIQ